jgi:dipeptidyl aminopeptidase/acylaminoacyl peptidase
MTSTPTTAPYGSWSSPVSLDLVLAGARYPAEPRLDGGSLWFVETRPDEGGREVVRRRLPDGTVHDVTPAGVNVRTRVHEYGGGAWTVHDGLVVFSTFPDGHLHTQRDGEAPVVLVTVDGLRFADLLVDAPRGRVIAVCEEHTAGAEPTNTLVAVDLADGSLTTLVGGTDFVGQPRLSRDGSRLSWVTWQRPAMPWDATSLWVADLGPDGSVGPASLVAGGAQEAVTGAVWAPDGSLVLTSDSTGWANLYRWRDGEDLVPIAPMDADFFTPQWVFAMHCTAMLDDGRVLAVGRSEGVDSLYLLADAAVPRKIEVGAPELFWLSAAGSTGAMVAMSPHAPDTVLLVDVDAGTVLPAYSASELPVDPAYLSSPVHVEFPTVGDRTAFAFYYPPTNPDVVAPPGELPPLVVVSHGGPTAHAMQRLNLEYQYWTSRGIAVVDVDYGGSTGYGREFRNRLKGNWGVVDLDDCTAAPLWLAEQGLADHDRLVIRGGSAGGFTTLCALAFRDVFAAGASYFGVGDLEALARDTHKFESRYCDELVAPYPEQVQVFRDRSPVHHSDGITAPLLVLQGTDDHVVPQAQADDMVAALARNGVPHAYLLFEGEGHGFVDEANQRRSHEAEMSFYAQVLGFSLADEVEPIEVIGLTGRT